MSMNRILMLQLEKTAPSQRDTPIVPGGRTLSTEGRAKKRWSRAKERASAISAIKSQQAARKAKYNASRK